MDKKPDYGEAFQPGARYGLAAAVSCGLAIVVLSVTLKGHVSPAIGATIGVVCLLVIIGVVLAVLVLRAEKFRQGRGERDDDAPE